MLAKQVYGVKAIIVRHANLECEGFGSTSAQSISFTSLHVRCLQPRSRFWLTVASCSHFSYTLHLPPEFSHPNFSHTTLTHSYTHTLIPTLSVRTSQYKSHSTAIRSGKLSSIQYPISQYPITFYFTSKTRFQFIHQNSPVLISSCTLVFDFINAFLRLLPFSPSGRRVILAPRYHSLYALSSTPKNYQTD
jgi:hypothetical protein